MISKERLLAGLNEIVYVEEGMVSVLTNFSKALVEHTDEMAKEKKDAIKRILTKLANDSARHKETIEHMIRKVEADTKNEY